MYLPSELDSWYETWDLNLIEQGRFRGASFDLVVILEGVTEGPGPESQAILLCHLIMDAAHVHFCRINFRWTPICLDLFYSSYGKETTLSNLQSSYMDTVCTILS